MGMAYLIFYQDSCINIEINECFFLGNSNIYCNLFQIFQWTDSIELVDIQDMLIFKNNTFLNVIDNIYDFLMNLISGKVII